MTHILTEDESISDTSESIFDTSGETQPLANEVSMAEDSATPTEPSIHFVPSLKLIALIALEGVIRNQTIDGTLDRTLPLLFATIIESWERSCIPAEGCSFLSDQQTDECCQVLKCLHSLFEDRRITNDQKRAYDRLLMRNTISCVLDEVERSIARRESVKNEEAVTRYVYEDNVVYLLNGFTSITTRKVFKENYDDVMPLLLLILRQKRSEAHHIAAFSAISRFGDAVRMSRFRADFVQAFAYFISGNPKLPLNNTTLDSCIGCDEKTANVVIRKACESDVCNSCRCPPVWCCGCLARSFLASAPSVDQEATCPTCRAKYCVKDVAIVSDGSDVSDDEMSED